MLRQEFMEQLSRLGAICPRAQRFMSDDEEKTYVTEIERRFLGISKLMWADIITWVIDHHKTRQLPTSHEFNDAMQAVHKNAPAGARIGFKCLRCDGRGMIFHQVKLVGDPDELAFEAVKPCPDCRSETQGWRLKEEIVEVGKRMVVEG